MKEHEDHPGHDRLWEWFGLSYASWLTLPRVLMHEMPDDWQGKMADLLHEWNATWDSSDIPAPCVIAKAENRFTKWPEWVLNYRRPDRAEIQSIRASNEP